MAASSLIKTSLICNAKAFVEFSRQFVDTSVGYHLFQSAILNICVKKVQVKRTEEFLPWQNGCFDRKGTFLFEAYKSSF